MTRGTVDRRPSRGPFLGRVALLLVSIGLLSLSLVGPAEALAASVEPVTSLQDDRLAGNPTCAEIAAWYGGGQSWSGAKIDREPAPGTYEFGAGRSITISGWDPTTGTLDWTSTFGVDAVLFKAGQGNGGFNTLYVYAPTAASVESLGDTGLRSLSPTGVSHVDFCWDTGAPSPSPSPEASLQPSASPGASPSPSPEASLQPSASPGASPSPSPEASSGPVGSPEAPASPSPSPTGGVLPAVVSPAVTPPPTDDVIIIGTPDRSPAWLAALAVGLASLAALAVAIRRRSRQTG